MLTCCTKRVFGIGDCNFWFLILSPSFSAFSIQKNVWLFDISTHRLCQFLLGWCAGRAETNLPCSRYHSSPFSLRPTDIGIRFVFHFWKNLFRPIRPVALFVIQNVGQISPRFFAMLCSDGATFNPVSLVNSLILKARLTLFVKPIIYFKKTIKKISGICIPRSTAAVPVSNVVGPHSDSMFNFFVIFFKTLTTKCPTVVWPIFLRQPKQVNKMFHEPHNFFRFGRFTYPY